MLDIDLYLLEKIYYKQYITNAKKLGGQMITKRTGNGQTECARCKEKGKFALTWDSFLFTYNAKPYCPSC